MAVLAHLVKFTTVQSSHFLPLSLSYFSAESVLDLFIFVILPLGCLKMAVNSVHPDHTVFCPENCSVKHNEMIIALSAISDDSRKPPDLGALKVALYSHLQTGWNAHSSVPDALSEFRFPLVHWACVLGRTQALSWLLSKMKFRAFVVSDRTGETGLHRALRLLHQVRSRDATPRSADFICSKFSLVLYTLTEQDPHGLFMKDKVQGNSAFHICALCISQQRSANSELEYYENCMKILVVRVTSLLTMEKLPKDSLYKVLNSKNDRGETILHILARSNICIKTVKYLLEDYNDLLNKFTTNHESKTPLDIARERQADLVEKELLESSGLGVEQLARAHPDLYQLYTQDADEVPCNATAAAVPNTSDNADSAAQSRVDKDACGGYSLRVSSFLPREGFYRSSSQGQASSEDSLSQDEFSHSPSLLDSTSVSYSEMSATNTVSSALNVTDSEPESASQQLANITEEDGCIPVVVENSVLINLQEDETTDDEDPNGNTVVVNCVVNSSEATLPYNSNPFSESSQCSESVLQMEESEDVSEAALANMASPEESTCTARAENPVAHDNDVCSSLAKVIRQESDVASMLVARLQDKKEQNRVELRRAQRELTRKQERENEASCTLLQLKAELENLNAQKENLERRREELLEELKSTEGNIIHLQEESRRLQSRVDEQARIAETFTNDRQEASEECASLKRKFNEYSEALTDICFPGGESKAKKERADDE